jgi:hypothetical protein
MTTTFTTILFFVLIPILILGAIVNWALETPGDRAKRWHQTGTSKAEIGRRLGVTKYRVNKLLAA